MYLMKKISQHLLKGMIVFIVLTNCKGQSKEDDQNNKDTISRNKQYQSSQITHSQGMKKVTDKEVKTFVSIISKIRGAQQQIQMQAMQAIKNSGIDMNKFREIAKSQQDTSAQQTQYSKQDMESYNKASKEIQTLQIDAQEKTKGIIESEGMSVQRYQQISQAARQDSTLQKRLKAELQSQMQQQMQQQPK